VDDCACRVSRGGGRLETDGIAAWLARPVLGTHVGGELSTDLFAKVRIQQFARRASMELVAICEDEGFSGSLHRNDGQVWPRCSPP